MTVSSFFILYKYNLLLAAFYMLMRLLLTCGHYYMLILRCIQIYLIIIINYMYFLIILMNQVVSYYPAIISRTFQFLKVKN